MTKPTRTFHYPSAFVSLPDHTAHRGQQVEVIRPLTRQEYDFQGEAMFLIRASDGWEGHAYRSELQDKAQIPFGVTP